MTEQRLGILEVDCDLLRKALHLPEGTEFLDAEMDIQRFGTIKFKISHADLKSVKEGHHIERVDAWLGYRTVEVINADAVGRLSYDVIEFQGWH